MSKGSRREREFVDLCHQARLGTYRPATVQFNENDIAGLLDVLAFSPSHNKLMGFQVKSNGARGINAWSRRTWLLRRLNIRTFYAVPYDNKGWRIIECTQHGRVECVDERNADYNVGEGVVQWLKAEGMVKR